MEQLQYPIGRFTVPENVTDTMRQAWIIEIATLPQRLEAALAGITEAQLETPYRPGGWTVRQVVHHLADSHLNAHCRLRLALTEDQPTIKPYMESKWALLSDYSLPIESSLNILRNVHFRWVHLLQNMDAGDFGKSYIHPEFGKVYTMDTMTALYVWHGNHHLGHVGIVMSYKV